jgi:hypothetical protein
MCFKKILFEAPKNGKSATGYVCVCKASEKKEVSGCCNCCGTVCSVLQKDGKNSEWLELIAHCKKHDFGCSFYSVSDDVDFTCPFCDYHFKKYLLMDHLGYSKLIPHCSNVQYCKECKKYIKVDDYEEHLKKLCPGLQEFKQCQKCGENIVINDAKHASICKNTLICSLCNEEKFDRKADVLNFLNHECKCFMCQKKVIYGDLRNHLADDHAVKYRERIKNP